MSRTRTERDERESNPLLDPEAFWREQPADDNQIRHIYFLSGRRLDGLTKSQAFRYIDELTKDKQKLQEYEKWIAEGEPDIAQWRDRKRRQIRLVAARVAIAFVFMLVVLSVVFLFWITNAAKKYSPAAPQVAAATPALPVTRVAPTPVAKPIVVTPTAPPLDEETKAAQRRAIELFPSLGVAGSKLNRAFVKRMRMYQHTEPEIFQNPEWPTIIARECFDELENP